MDAPLNTFIGLSFSVTPDQLHLQMMQGINVGKSVPD